MNGLTYQVVEHDGGFAYRVKDVFSETFPTHEAALTAAKAAAARQQLEGETTDIEYEDAAGQWHEELARAGDRPPTRVEDSDLGGADAVLRGEAEDELEAERLEQDRRRPEQDEEQTPNYSRDVGADEPLPDGPGE